MAGKKTPKKSTKASKKTAPKAPKPGPDKESHRLTNYRHHELPPQPDQKPSDDLDPTILKRGEVLVSPGPDLGHRTILCHVEGCENERIIKSQDAFQVKRCPGCQTNFKKAQRRALYLRRKEAKQKEGQ